MQWLPVSAPGTPVPAFPACRTVAVVGDTADGGGAAGAEALVRALAARGAAVTVADAQTADLVVFAHGLLRPEGVEDVGAGSAPGASSGARGASSGAARAAALSAGRPAFADEARAQGAAASGAPDSRAAGASAGPAPDESARPHHAHASRVPVRADDPRLTRAFADLTALAARPTPPRLLVGLAGASPLAAGLAGLVKTAALEWQAAWLSLTLDAPAPAALADAAPQVADALLGGGIAREVRLGARRHVRTRVAGPAAGSARGITPGPWVISGGARGVTATCAIALAQAGASRILLLGRSRLEPEPAVCAGLTDEPALKRALITAAGPKPDLRAIGRQVSAILGQREIRATVHALEEAGAEVRYAPVDVARHTDVASAIADTRALWGPFRGLIHGAGVLADKRLGEKTAEQFASVLQPKLDGVDALLAACESDPLEQICFFSSVAAHSGNAGQSDYAAANAVLDALAEAEQARRGPQCHVVSTAWGPWAGGMVTESLARHFTARGIALIPQQDGARALVDELARGTATQVILGCGLDQMDAPPIERLRISPTRWPLLHGHRIEHAIVMPMTMALDALMGVGREHLGAACELRELRLVKGVVLTDDNAELDVQVAAGASGTMQVSLVHPEGRPAYQATAQHSDAREPRPAPMALPAPQTDPVSDVCRDPYASALFHGPSFQVIRQITVCSDHQIAARLATAGAMGWPDEWQIDPATLDGALQLLRVWGVARDGRHSLPTSIGRCRVWQTWPAQGEVGCVLECRKDNAFKLTADARFFDLATGAVLVSLDGIVMHVHGS